MEKKDVKKLEQRIEELEARLEESEQLIRAIKAGEVDAFAISSEKDAEIYTLQSGDYAYRILIEEFQEGAINVTEEGLIVYTNPYFLSLLNLPYEQVVGSYIFDFIHADSADEFTEIFLKSHTGKSKAEINLEGNGIVIPVYVSLTSLQPKLATVGILITDLSQKKKNEAVILKYQADLETKNHELLQMNTELASFTYVASHDLQEPLRKIQTFASRIKEIDRETLSESGLDHFNRMQKAAQRMQTLIQDLLSYSRTNSAERVYKNTDLNKIVEEVKEDLKEELQVKHAKIIADKMCNANIIPFQFRQLLHNLISNSLKFATPGKDPVINIQSEHLKGSELDYSQLEADIEYCHISISDNGIGFEQHYHEKIFELFQRLHGKYEFPGTGIGLAIVKKIVDNHHGLITAKSELNKGASFDIYFPSVD